MVFSKLDSTFGIVGGDVQRWESRVLYWYRFLVQFCVTEAVVKQIVSKFGLRQITSLAVGHC